MFLTAAIKMLQRLTDRDRIEMLEEENRQLRDQLARLAGFDLRESIRIAFGMTELQAGFVAILLTRGHATREQIIEALYGFRDLQGTYQSAGALAKHVRVHLRKHEIELGTIYNYGWEFSDAMRAKARTLLAKVAA
jgi:hypothetical protein